MSFILEDGTGSGKKAKVDGDNRLATFAVQTSEEHHENEDNKRAWTASFDALDPTGADDYFAVLQNTDTAIRAVSRLIVSSTTAGILEFQRVTITTLSGGSADEVNSWSLGEADPSGITFETGVNITGITDAGVLRFITLVANVGRVIEFFQTARLKQNEAIALLWTAGDGVLTGNIDFYEEG